jgi:3-oxoacyl-[acyl-carrier-protein] synthase-3
MGFTNGIIVLANMIELGQVKAGIIIGSEGSKQLIESTIDELLNDENVDRAKLKRAFATLTLGSGAAVVMLVHSSISSNGHKLLGGAVRTASKYNGLCRIENDTCFFDPGRSPTMKTDYESILRVGQMLAPETWNATKRELCWDDHDVDKVFFHQVSAVHHKLLFEALGLDESKGFSTVEYLGNVASCSLPISFALGIEEGLIHKGDKVLLVAGGSGISSVMLGIEW